MKVIVDFSVVPIGVGVSVSNYVAECQKIIKKAGLKYLLHGYGTNVEGEWDEVFSVIKECHEKVHEMGAPRISTVIKLGTRIDKQQSINDKIESVDRKLGKQ
jgi:uncharacterized protein (TIGR00106 family)